MEIIRGKKKSVKKVVIYGPEGIGKSTFASKFPDPLFIDTEGSTNDMDVARFEKATSWTMLKEQVRYVLQNPDICKTLVLDTADWAEQMCVEDVCSSHNKKGIEDFGYGNGYVYAKEEWGKFLNLLQDVVDKGIHVVVTAHSHIRKFEQPDELGAYDRYELKLGKKTQSQTSPLLKEWADMLLFANYKTLSVAADKDGKKYKAQGGRRVMYANHHPCWDAKNRYGLPDEMPFDYGEIAHVVTGAGKKTPDMQEAEPPKIEMPAEDPAPVETASPKKVEEPEKDNPAVPEDGSADTKPFPKQDERIPKQLRDLMELHHVDEWELQAVVEAKGYMTAGTPIWEYDDVNPGIVDGLLVASWDQVYAAVQEMREKQEIPFN